MDALRLARGGYETEAGAKGFELRLAPPGLESSGDQPYPEVHEDSAAPGFDSFPAPGFDTDGS